MSRRRTLVPDAYGFGTATGEYQSELQTTWETLHLLAYGIEPRPSRTGVEWNREQLRKIDLRWHDLRHEGACRLLPDGVDIRIIQLMLGHASIQQTQRYLNVTDEELRRGLEVSWNNKGRPLRPRIGSLKCSTARKLCRPVKNHDRPARLSHICHTRRPPASIFGCGARNERYLQLWRPAA